MIKTKVMDMTNPQDVEAVLIGYYLLFSPELQCIEQKTTPETEHLTREDVIVVVAYDEADGIRGIMMVDNDAVLFPVLSGDPVETLKALSLAAYEANGHYLEFQTENQLICDLALAMNIPEIKHEGNYFWWGDKANQVAAPWGGGS